MRITTLLLAAGLTAAGVGGWIWLDMQPVPVGTVAVEVGTAAEVVYASGAVEPKTWAKVTPLVRKRIVEVCSCEGRDVAEGALLVRLDDSEVRANLRQLEAKRILAQKELARASDLLGRNVGSQQSFERAGAELASIEASLAAMMEQANDHLITAPIDGVVLRLDASVGEISVPGEALAWVGRPKPLEVVADVNEEDIPRVAEQQQVLLRSDAFPGKALPATVSAITPMGDPVARIYRVRLALPDDTPLFIGMSVDANIVIREEPDALLVPAAALSGSRVYVIEDGRLAERPVTIGVRGLEKVQILTGLSAGDQVVMPLPEDVAVGDPVRVEEAVR